MSTLKVLKSEATGVVYADPQKPDFQVRFKTTNGQKGLNGVTVQNYVAEIIYTDNNPVALGSVSAQDAVSVRLRVSGSQASEARLDVILKSLAAQLPEWVDENVFVGFAPESAPVVPAL